MSWTLSVVATPKADFATAVDAAVATGQDSELPGVAEDVAAARAALKELGARCKRPVVAGYASGHALQSEEGDSFMDGISVSVHGSPGGA